MTKANQTITVTTAAPSSHVYNGTFTVAATSDSGLSVSYGGAGGCRNSGTTYTMISSTTACTVTFDQAGDANDNATPQVTEMVTATKATATLSLSNLSQAYDGTAEYAPTNAGSYNVDVSLSNPNYTASDATGTLVIAQAPQSISFSLTTFPTKTHGDGNFAIGSYASGGPSGNAVSFSSATTSVCTVSGSTVTILSARTCTLNADQAGDSNYHIASQVQQSFTVGRKAITVLAGTPPSQTYGSASAPTITCTSTDFVGSDTFATSPAGAAYDSTGTSQVTIAATSSAGSYTTKCSDGDPGSNYTISGYTPGAFTIHPATLTVAPDAGQSMVYGSTAVPPISFKVSGFQNRETSTVLSNQPSCATSATAYNGTTADSGSSAGTYSIICSGGQPGNDTFSYNPDGVQFAVTPASLTITADSKTMTYGGTLPALTWTANFVNGDTQGVLSASPNVAPNCSTVAASSPVGIYDITCSGASDADYSIAYAKGTLSINQAATTTSLASAANPSILAQSVTLTASVSAVAPGGGTPTWTVTFKDGSTTLGAGSLSGGTATFTASSLAVGTHSLTASYRSSRSPPGGSCTARAT